MENVINYFNYNISLEHSAIIQYLFHAYTIKDENLEKDLEEIAREEMKHLRMFAHAVVMLGGMPAIDQRAEVFLEAPTIEELIGFDIEAEKMAIDVYEKQLKDIEDPKIKKILERVIQDESSHLHIFKALQEKIKENISQNNQSNYLDENKTKIVGILNKHIQKQYKAILESLYESFILKIKNPNLSDEIEQRAIDKMKHFGWIAEKMKDLGTKPNVNLPSIGKLEDQDDIIKSQVEDQRTISEEISNIAKSVENKELQWILDRIAKREIHYTDLETFLSRKDISDKDIANIISAFTVGSMFGQKK